jgi:hypothetical protein
MAEGSNQTCLTAQISRQARQSLSHVEACPGMNSVSRWLRQTFSVLRQPPQTDATFTADLDQRQPLNLSWLYVTVTESPMQCFNPVEGHSLAKLFHSDAPSIRQSVL